MVYWQCHTQRNFVQLISEHDNNLDSMLDKCIILIVMHFLRRIFCTGPTDREAIVVAATCAMRICMAGHDLAYKCNMYVRTATTVAVRSCK